MRNATPLVLSLLRVMAGLLFIEHGGQKILGFPPPDPAMAGHPMNTLMLVGGWLELVGGALIVLGLFTRGAAFILSGEMAVAYFMAHAPQNFFPVLNKGELAVLYCFVFLYLFFAGPGPISLDATLRKKL
jgi:putative oxidoreductase